jgi:DNA-binding LacI/PurR family transcriptional regulator
MSVIDEIARRAGVSTSTVTRVLNGGGSYHRAFYAERAERIKAIAVSLGYRPNAAAQAVRTGRFGSICLLSNDDFAMGHLPAILIDNICKACQAHGLMLSLARLPEEEPGDPGGLPAILTRLAADGLLINSTHAIPPGMEEVLAEQGRPVVWLNAKRKHDCIHFADQRAAREVTRQLIERGHRRIGFFAPHYEPCGAASRRHYSITDRLAGYRQALREAGLAEVVYTPQLQRDWTLGEDMRQIFGHPERPTAILSMLNAESLVVGALRQGLRVPEDVSICRFSHAVGNGRGLPTATCLIPDWELAQRAVDMLLRRIAQPTVACPREVIPIPLLRPHFLHDRNGNT